MTTASKNLYIKTWGCQMNVYDSRKMADVLRPLGYVCVDSPDNADMIILNTCHIREKATDKVFSELGRLKSCKEEVAKLPGRRPLMAVAGCVAQAEGDYILERAPCVDMVFGPQTYHELPEMVAKALEAGGRPRIVRTDFPAEAKFDSLPAGDGAQGPAAFLSVQEGCDKFCTFCVVPYTRGAEYSRPAAAVLDEARHLASGGVREITLLGQNVNAFHGEAPEGGGRTWGLGRLLQELAGIEGVERLRYTTSHPRDMDGVLIAAHRDIPALMPFLHLPVQSGADRILKLMNRKHTADDYRRIIERLREARPDLALSSDFITGFPGETDADFAETLKLAEDIRFAQAYSFKYSARPGTPAANMPGLVREEVKTERIVALQEILNRHQHEFNRACEGRVLPVLIERKGRDPGQIQGRTPYNQAVNISAPERLIGQIVDVRIEEGLYNSVRGVPVTGEAILTDKAA